MSAEHEARLRASLAAYPQGHSTDNQARLLVSIRAADLTRLLGDLEAYRKTWEVISAMLAAEAKDANADTDMLGNVYASVNITALQATHLAALQPKAPSQHGTTDPQIVVPGGQHD